MAYEFTCPACHGLLRVEETATGGLVRCGACLTLLRVPKVTNEGNAPESRPMSSAAPLSRQAESQMDQGDRPRPRHRRRRRPPAGRGALFWIAIVFGGLGLGTCACCGGIYVILPGANWRTHESAPGSFRVDFPAPPQDNLPIPGLKADPNMKLEGTILWKRGEVYAVMYYDIPAATVRVKTDEMLLAEAERGVEREAEVESIVRKQSIKVSGFKGKEIEYIAKDGGTYIGRIIVANDRLYTVVGGGRFVSPGNANIRRFLDSFTIVQTNPAPELAPRRRPEKAK